jgi:hypothetical protein
LAEFLTDEVESVVQLGAALPKEGISANFISAPIAPGNQQGGSPMASA